VDCSIVSSPGCGEFTIDAPYYFKYCLPDRVFDVGGVVVSATKVDSSSPELVSEATSSFLSCRDTHHIVEECFGLAFGFPVVTVVHCWLSTMSRWTHIICPEGVGKTFLLLTMRICTNHS